MANSDAAAILSDDELMQWLLLLKYRPDVLKAAEPALALGGAAEARLARSILALHPDDLSPDRIERIARGVVDNASDRAMAGEWPLPEVPAAPRKTTIGPSGIKGWLIFPAIHVVVEPLLLVSSIGLNLRLLKSFRSVISIQPAFGTVIMIEIIVAFVLLLLAIYLGYSFFRKRARARQLYVVMGFVYVIWSFVDAIMVAYLGLPVDWLTPFMFAIVAAIWITYFRHSSRVQNTFVR